MSERSSFMLRCSSVRLVRYLSAEMSRRSLSIRSSEVSCVSVESAEMSVRPQLARPSEVTVVSAPALDRSMPGLRSSISTWRPVKCSTPSRLVTPWLVAST